MTSESATPPPVTSALHAPRRHSRGGCLVTRFNEAPAVFAPELGQGLIPRNLDILEQRASASQSGEALPQGSEDRPRAPLEERVPGSGIEIRVHWTWIGCSGPPAIFERTARWEISSTAGPL